MRIILFYILTVYLYGAPFLRTPSISNNGEKIAFSYQGDIWISNSDGSNPQRLTIHESYDYNPVFNDAGNMIAFTSNRFGNEDIFTINLNSGNVERITFHPSSDLNASWYKNEIYFNTSRIYNTVEWMDEIFKVKSNGSTPERAFDFLGEMAEISPNGKFIAFVRGACRVSREAYRGSANRDIWIYNIETNDYFQITDFDGNDYLPKWSDNSSLFFISSKDGLYNIFEQKISDSGDKLSLPIKITNETDYGIRHFDVDNSGNNFIYESDNGVYLFEKNKSTEKLSLSFPNDFRFDPIEFKSFTSDITDFDISPSGKLLVFSVRGEIFIKENNKDKKNTKNLSNHPYRDINPLFVNDSTILFISDRSGQYEIYKITGNSEGTLTSQFKFNIDKITETDEDESSLFLSNDRKKIGYLSGRGRLIVSDIDSAGNFLKSVTLLDGWASPSSLSFSPDNRYLAYSIPDLNYNDEVFIHDISEKGKPINVSMHPRGDYNPVWSRDGSKLLFISERNNNNSDVWFAWLKKSDWQLTKNDRDEMDKEEKKDSSKTKEIKIDFENIHERLVQVTSFPGDERNIEVSEDGETIYFTIATLSDKPERDMFSIKWTGEDLKEITKGNKSPYSLKMNSKGDKIYFLSRGGNLNEMTVKGEKVETLPFKAEIQIDHTKEKEQIFEEAWRSLNTYFYDPNFHGKDWNELKKTYKPFALSATTDQDFRYIFNIMLGQINASHMGIYGNPPEDLQKIKSGLLGIEVITKSDKIVINRILENSPADKEFSKLEIGDIVLAINGHQINSNENIYKYLSNTSGELVLLEVQDKSGKIKEVKIRPESNLSNEKYESFVKSRKKLTDEYSNGRLGYIHIRGMDLPSFERFERELTAAGYGKEGIVIDVRYNGGGWTTDYLMTVIDVRQHAYTIPRGAAENLEKENKKFTENYPYGERLPYAALTVPSVALCNSMSYSNAEIFSHAYKTLEIGKLVGEPTFGAVISTWGASLIDGSLVRLPGRAWYVKATGKSMENIPATPDFIVENHPENKGLNKDPQLKKAIEVLLNQLDN